MNKSQVQANTALGLSKQQRKKVNVGEKEGY
jgi:hypothetical protein